MCYLNHSHKKRKDSLETRGELDVLRAYVEKKAILELILLYLASTFLCDYRQLFFLFFFVKMQTKQDQTVL